MGKQDLHGFKRAPLFKRQFLVIRNSHNLKKLQVSMWRIDGSQFRIGHEGNSTDSRVLTECDWAICIHIVAGFENTPRFEYITRKILQEIAYPDRGLTTQVIRR